MGLSAADYLVHSPRLHVDGIAGPARPRVRLTLVLDRPSWRRRSWAIAGTTLPARDERITLERGVMVNEDAGGAAEAGLAILLPLIGATLEGLTRIVRPAGGRLERFSVTIHDGQSYGGESIVAGVGDGSWQTWSRRGEPIESPWGIPSAGLLLDRPLARTIAELEGRVERLFPRGAPLGSGR